MLNDVKRESIRTLLDVVNFRYRLSEFKTLHAG